ncbi:hypothetical protein MRB53_024183 [Persea americana]|uniref:Uncharacterized protein n=1 Tax=Persea americana TaxID=3435 RepID=A0ACC2LC71_PERAE|nr:hypothetical protein MRB53_024183 [Persea americana]
MGLEEEEEDEKRELLQPSFLEVACRSSGKLRRFAAGAEAGFALNLINRKLGAGTQPSLYIEAVKEGEEPVSFGPNSVLVNYGEGWKLQTVLAEDYEDGKRVQPNTKQFPPSTKSFNNHPDSKVVSVKIAQRCCTWKFRVVEKLKETGLFPIEISSDVDETHWNS